MNALKTIMLVLFVVVGTDFYAQDLSKDEKKITKCWSIFHRKGYDKGIKKLRKYMSKQEWPSILAYESLVSMEYTNFNHKSKLFGFDITVERNGVLDDSLTKTFQDIMSHYYLNHFLDVCRTSTMESTSPSADVYLRQFMVDVNPDTLVSDEALNYFTEAERFFINKDFELAELNYRKALAEDADYYKAYLYLGDSFWARNEYDSAMVYYEIARKMQPNLLEPRIYIIDVLVDQELLYRAKQECYEALTVYPGQNIKYKLQRILYVENKYLNEHRLSRRFFINDIANNNQPNLESNPFWADYRKAKDEVSKYCNADGIIESNGEVEDRYLEVYSIRRMLEQHNHDLPAELHFADKMKDEGMLEPYVFVSLFHVDMYPQFKDYMSRKENRKRTVEFIEKYLIEPIPN